LEKGVHLKFHYSLAVRVRVRGASQQKKLAAILLTTACRLPFFVAATIS
jgi:hypothetical protein